MSTNLKNKVVIITGAASGLGLDMAKKFANDGSRIVIADLNVDIAESVANSLKIQYKVDAMAIGMDVSNELEVNTGIDKVITNFGQVDVLISNAGIQIIHPIVDFPYNEWVRLFNIHVHGAFLTTKACMQNMIKSKAGGRIIITGSVHSFEASVNKAAYVAAKHALLGFVRSIAKEGAPHNISSNLIAPGFVRTPLVDKQIPEQAVALGISENEVVKKIMLGETVDGEFTTTDDISDVALFLAGFPTNALTGQYIIASHGWHM